jgi:hypothetical protein
MYWAQKPIQTSIIEVTESKQQVREYKIYKPEIWAYAVSNADPVVV